MRSEVVQIVPMRGEEKENKLVILQIVFHISYFTILLLPFDSFFFFG